MQVAERPVVSRAIEGDLDCYLDAIASATVIFREAVDATLNGGSNGARWRQAERFQRSGSRLSAARNRREAPQGKGQGKREEKGLNAPAPPGGHRDREGATRGSATVNDAFVHQMPVLPPPWNPVADPVRNTRQRRSSGRQSCPR